MDSEQELLQEDWDILGKCPKDEIECCCYYELLRYRGKLARFIRVCFLRCNRMQKFPYEPTPEVDSALAQASYYGKKLPRRFRPWLCLDKTNRSFFQGVVQFHQERYLNPLKIFADDSHQTRIDLICLRRMAEDHTPGVPAYFHIAMNLSETTETLVEAFKEAIPNLRSRFGVKLRTESKNGSRPEWRTWLRAIGAARLLGKFGSRVNVDDELQKQGLKAPYENRGSWGRCESEIEKAWDHLFGGNRF